MRHYQNGATAGTSLEWMTGERYAYPARSARRSLSKLIRFVITAAVQIMILALVIQMTIGFGVEGQPGPMPAPAPSFGPNWAAAAVR